MVKHDPESGNNFTLLHEFYPLIIQANQLAFGQSAYRNAFDYHYETFAGPTHLNDDRDEDQESDGEEDEGNTMSLEHVIALVDILTTVEKLEEAVEVVRKGQRWLQGRVEQKYWDTFEDDREYAPEGEEGHELDIGLRHRLALLRLRLGNDEEAFVSYLSTTQRNVADQKGHIGEILQLDVVAHQDMFVELGEALMKRELWERALDCFASINEEDAASRFSIVRKGTNDQIEDEPSNIYALGVCLHQTGKAEQALDYLRWGVFHSVHEEQES